MSNDALLEEDLKAWLADYLSVRQGRIDLDTRINFDLGVDAQDGFDLINAIGARYNIDVTYFPFQRYFGPETFNPLAFVGSLYRWIRGKNARGLEPLTVRHLLAMLKKAEE